MVSTSHETVPIISHNRGTKPYWGPQLTQLSRHDKAVWRLWLEDGRPREQFNTWRQYKAAKRNFRRAQRYAEYQYNLKFLTELADIEQIDCRYFWYLVNKANKPMIASTKRLQATKDTCGVLLYDQDEINKSWESYLSDLHKPKCKPQYDNEHQHIVDNTILHLPNTYFSNNDLPKIFSVEDVENKCKKLKFRKAAGWDSISGEHLRYGGYTRLYIYYITQLLYANWFQHISRRVLLYPFRRAKTRI